MPGKHHPTMGGKHEAAIDKHPCIYSSLSVQILTTAENPGLKLQKKTLHYSVFQYNVD
jgi:hypothetical protein